MKRHSIKWPFVLLLFVVLGFTAAQGQRLEPSFRSYGESAPRFSSAPAGRLAGIGPSQRDYRFEGTLVGALVLGVAGAWIGNAACQNQPEPLASGSGPDCGRDALSVGLVGGVIGAGLGYLIGRGFPKHS